MTLTQLFAQVNSAYRGSDDNPPTTGDDFSLWLMTANRKQSEWALDSKNVWESLFSINSLATPLAAGTQVYNLSSTLVVPADDVKVVTATQTIQYTICKAQERDRFTNSVYVSGSNPQKLNFADTIIAGNPAIGGTIKIAGYFAPADFTLGTDNVLVNDPYWLVYAIASELAFNDLTYESKYSELNNKANNLYTQMALANRRGTSNNPRTARTNVQRILDTRYEEGSDN